MRFCSAAVAVFLIGWAFVGFVGAQEESAVMEILIEKAREREAVFDGLDLSYSGRAYSNPVLPVQMKADFSGRWVQSGERYRMDVAVEGKQGERDQSIDVTAVSDGQTARNLFVQPEHTYGEIEKPSADEMRRDMPTPGGMGITSIFQTPGSLSEMLEADVDKLNAKYGDSVVPPGSSVKSSVVGTETIGERECVVVLLAMRRHEGQPERVSRMYFAEDVNYSCVKFELGRARDEGFEVRGAMTLDDFREVKEGLFVPFAGKAEGYTPNGVVQVTLELAVESFEFPASFDESLFTVEFPSGTQVHDQVAGVSYTAGEGPALDDVLEEVVEEVEEEVVEAAPEATIAEAAVAEEPAVETPVIDEPDVAEESGGKARALLLLAGGIVLLGVAVFVLLRAKSSK